MPKTRTERAEYERETRQKAFAEGSAGRRGSRRYQGWLQSKERPADRLPANADAPDYRGDKAEAARKRENGR